MSDSEISNRTDHDGPKRARSSIGNVIEGGVVRFGNLISFLILLIMLFTSYEVCSRYFFNRPTSWVWLVNRQLFAVFALVGGAYTMAHGMHIRIEMLMERYNPVMKWVVRSLSLGCAFIFLGVLIWDGSVLGWISFGNKEFTPGNFHMPLYPVKLFLPFAATLFLIETIVSFFKKKL